ncbi:helicase-like transcription factor CHR28 isoform X2 [Tasmannia lanceolata]|uniref:helicase-like transcription factor CHR28 isoform X2 n=1 Tax=Tasmannia lanceolata TaxID=3420 RepID=UPI0040649641
MLRADNSSSLLEGDPFDEFEDLSIDIESFYAILNEGPHTPSPSSPEDLSCKYFSQDGFVPIAVNNEKISHPQNGSQESVGASLVESRLLSSSPLSQLNNLGASDSRSGTSMEFFFEPTEKLGNLNEIHCPLVLGHGGLDASAQIETKISPSSCPSSLTSDWLTLSSSEYGPCYRRDSVGGSSDLMLMDESGLSCSSINMARPFIDADESLPSRPQPWGHIKPEMDNDQVTDIMCKAFGPCSAVPSCSNLVTDAVDSPFSDYASGQLPDFISNNGQMMGCIKDEREDEHLPDFISNNNGQMMGCIKDERDDEHLPDFISNNGQMMGCIKDERDDEQFLDFISINGNMMGCIKDERDDEHLSDLILNNNGQMMGCIKDEGDEELLAPQSKCSSSIIGLGTHKIALHISVPELPITDMDVPIPEIQYSEINSCQNSNFSYKEIGSCLPEMFGRDCASGADFANQASRQFLPLVSMSKKQTDERQDQLLASHSMHYHSVKGIDEKNLSEDNSDDDTDICILEEMSDPRHPPAMVTAAAHGRSNAILQHATFSDPLRHVGAGYTRLKENDERLTFRVALQRIALSWMVQKETASYHCSGGILADDQGLGKTISTIALILMERSPSSKLSSKADERVEFKALNLDEDDDGVLELDGMKQARDSCNIAVNRRLMKSESAFAAGKGRPAAGTLIVCPTSVLRQWAEELRNKVHSKANLSFLVYHGSNRTKDPDEVAKYDVVLTTYAIVSMEVPKQPLVDLDDEEKPEADGLPMGPSTGRKRKYPPGSNKKSMKDKKRMDGALLESAARPLARVGWFRVVLDEAQSIKNHRTQVARACWGLRAKRRWCLSGTPIQNAVDDLYSYFRFLRYDPYAGYKSFCSTIKVPITRNPTNGYKKLQAVLKTIMLRRTKGTLIDGEPIVNLPPKSVSLKKVVFSEQERAFYSKLEAESREQFKVYAAAGTVKENYVNILLMLLRLRQACDHPLLVKGYVSNSVWRSSVEMAKKLPRERQLDLLNCLEACLAICSICNDPPEDAVVTICGHVFCNQCICDHLTGDENSCPVAQCKVHLSVSSVFSKASLKNSLSNNYLGGHDCLPPDNSGSEQLVKTSDFFCKEIISDSSKIKAALEILQSLSKSRGDCFSECASNDEVASYSKGTSNSFLAKVGSKDICDDRHLDMERGTNLPPAAAEKAIVFSQWTRMLDLLEVPLRNSSIHYRRLDGTMSVVARDKALKDFDTLPEVTVMIMSLKAASLGLNMVAACHVLLLDLWWNPTTEDQAIDRAHRIGQTRPVTVSRLTVQDTVEDRILALQEKKREMVASAFGEDETGCRQTRLTVEDLKYLFLG